MQHITANLAAPPARSPRPRAAGAPTAAGAATAAGARFDVTWHARADDIAAELWDACFPPPAEGAWYYRALESGARAAHGGALRFVYGAVADGGRTVGIVPAFSIEVPLARVLRTRVLFVGSPTTVYGTVGLRAGVALDDVLPAVDRALDVLAARERAALVVWKDALPEHRAALDAQAARGRYCALATHAGTALAIPPTWEGYLAAMCGRRRYRLKKKLRAAGCALDAAVVQAPDAALRAELYALYRRTHERAAERFEELTPAFFAHVAAAPQAHFVILRRREDGRAVAFMLCFLIGARAVNRFVGLDYAYVAACNLHFRLWEAALRFMMAAGAREVHSGPTAYRFKRDTGHVPVPMRTYVRHRRRAVQHVAGMAVRVFARKPG